MSTVSPNLEQTALEAAAKLQAGGERPQPAERKRIPMSLPRNRLQTPDLPGYYLYWMRGDPNRLLQAQQAGYEFVTQEEIGMSIQNFDIGGNATAAGSTDMGSRVSVAASIAGLAHTEDGQPLRLYLMKQKWEYHLEDLALLENQNDRIAEALTASFVSGTIAPQAAGETLQDYALRRVDPKRTTVPTLFQRKTPKRS